VNIALLVKRAGMKCGKRLEELNWRTQTRSLDKTDHEEVVDVPDSKLPKA